MKATAILLVLSLIVVPTVSFFLDDPLTPLQLATLKELMVVYLVMALACFLAAEVTGNCSQVDKLWSVMP
ncbi:MAG: hypothetical protein KDB88_00275 [Flavobacteriales bacterium]|nr:hypothetical protein [Flavobacteriales bacterium]